MEKDKLLVNCACEGDGYLTVCVFEHDKEWTNEIYFHIDGHEMGSMWQRIQAAWSLIRYGKFENFGLMLDKARVQEIINYLESKKDKLR